VRYWANPVACQRQSQLQLRPIAATIASCKHPVRGLTKPPAASVLSLSSRARSISCLYTSRRCVILLCVSNLWRVPAFSKCSFMWHSAYFHSALYPSFRRKKIRIEFSANYPFTTFRIPYSAFRKIPLPYCILKTPNPYLNTNPNPTSILCKDSRKVFTLHTVLSKVYRQWFPYSLNCKAVATCRIPDTYKPKPNPYLNTNPNPNPEMVCIRSSWLLSISVPQKRYKSAL